VVQLSATQLDFGAVATHTSVTRQVLLSNTGNGTLLLSPPAVTGDAAFTAGITSCGATVQPGADCLTEVSFAPLDTGPMTGTLSFPSNAAHSPQQVTLQGSGYNPVSLTAAQLPSAYLGKPYAAYDFKPLLKVSNEQTPDKVLASWSVTGTLPAGLALSADGVLSGTPTALTAEAGAPFTLVATYRENIGQQAYTIQVGQARLQATQLVSGNKFSCALTSAGGVKCWGKGTSGQLGNGASVDSTGPVDVQGLTSGVSALAAGSAHMCAVTTAGAVKCWGANNNGQLGNGKLVASAIPVAVTGLTLGIVNVAVGVNHSCALTSAGGVKCWGQNYWYQAGTGSSTSYLPSPVSVSGLASGVAQISAGDYHTCAAMSAGGAKCWGRNENGELGAGNTYNLTTPADVANLTGSLTSISAKGAHTCVVTSAGAASCWGTNSSGELGVGRTYANTTYPVAVSGLGAGVAAVAAGGNHTCATLGGGAVKCWGANNAGQLGTGAASTTPGLLPADVAGLPNGATVLAGGTYHTCAVSAGTVKCWGDINGQTLPADVLE
jgi:alpha-tubulin suppressor-like RCC1 family protein